MLKRMRCVVLGRVQGVGFRPTVFRHAASLGLVGFVQNTPAGVVIEVEGDGDAISEFLARLRSQPPSQALLERIETGQKATLGSETTFSIIPSLRSGDLVVGLPPDLATCVDCRADLFDPVNVRFSYPFTNCTNCGPRFTIVTELPYDREKTSMSVFPLCSGCAAEYEDPANRRFDAQPNACPVCGPAIKVLGGSGEIMAVDSLPWAVAALAAGSILAIKGIGGYHLCCDAGNESVVRRLRARKFRPAKSLAVMFRSLDEIRRHCRIGPQEEQLLKSGIAPIVIVPRREDSSLAPGLSPDSGELGAFLPYSPLHHLLLDKVSPLVMTSGNLAEEPMARDEVELQPLLGRVADAALIHDRAIVRRIDDSVVRIHNGQPLWLRRSRGLVPEPIGLPFSGPPILACGGQSKNTFCVTRLGKAFLSQHMGDLQDFRAFRAFSDSIDDFCRLLQVAPEAIAHDMHPDYLSTRLAQSRGGRLLPVQHHHAHLAACMVEYGLTGEVIGVILDGSGYGLDNTIWGGEFLVGDLMSFSRVGFFTPYPLPGGEEAVRHPDRMAMSILLAEFPRDWIARCDHFLPNLSPGDRAVLEAMVRQEVNSPLTSSAGRIFDAVAALLGLGDEVSYEGRAAIRLQAIADPLVRDSYGFDILPVGSGRRLSLQRALAAIMDDMAGDIPVPIIAGRFHQTIAHAIAGMCLATRKSLGLQRVVLSGGVFQNTLLLGRTEDLLNCLDFEVFIPRLAPPNDGGLALGQAAIAQARLSSEDKASCNPG